MSEVDLKDLYRRATGDHNDMLQGNILKILNDRAYTNLFKIDSQDGANKVQQCPRFTEKLDNLDDIKNMRF